MTEPKRSGRTAAFSLLLIVCALILPIPGRQARAGPSAFSDLVDGYLDWFALNHPSIAAGNGLHRHDDRLEYFSAHAVRREIAELKRWRERLRAIDAGSLPADERVDHRILGGIIDGWLLDLETVQTFRRNPMVYAAALADGVHNLMNMESSPPETRMRRIIAKLEGVESLLAAARQNVLDPPRILAERGLAMFRGASTMLRATAPASCV